MSRSSCLPKAICPNSGNSAGASVVGSGVSKAETPSARAASKAQKIRKWAQATEIDGNPFGIVPDHIFTHVLEKWVYDESRGHFGDSMSRAEGGGFAALLLHFIACAEEQS